jgi:HlyD family secretion protein
VLLAGILAWQAMPHGQAVKAGDIDIATVSSGLFRDELTLRASAAPLASIVLDATEGGRVEAVYVHDGAMVKKGELLFKLSNAQRQQEVLARSAEVAQQISNLASLRVGLVASLVASLGEHRREVSDLSYEVDRAEKTHARNQALAEKGFLSSAALEESADKLAQQQRLLANARQTASEEQASRQQAIGQMDRAIAGLNDGLKLVKSTAEALAVRAPTDGRLTDFNLQEGESVKPGDRLGRVDTPDRFKLVSNVDEFYLSRVAPGLKGVARIGDRDVALTLSRLNPQVKDGRFSIEMNFDAAPGHLQPGQSLDGRLTLGQPNAALLLPDGAYYRDGGGSTVFVLDADGRHAERRTVRLGRRTAGQVEVLGGLRAGDKVVISSYQRYRDAKTLTIES